MSQLQMRPPIFLIGLPACGKTTLGRALARELSLQFIDLDKYIEARFSCSVADIFARYGEPRFREIERNMLREVGEMADVVIACGGGTPCHFAGMDYMLSRGLTIHLRTTRERLHERLCRKRARRPQVSALSDEEIYCYIDRIEAERLPVYSRARLTFDSTLLEDRDQISDSLSRLLPLLQDFYQLQAL